MSGDFPPCPISGRRYKTPDSKIRMSLPIVHAVSLIYQRWRHQVFMSGDLQEMLAQLQASLQSKTPVEASTLSAAGYIKYPGGIPRYRGNKPLNKPYVLSNHGIDYLHKYTEPVEGSEGYKDELLPRKQFQALAER